MNVRERARAIPPSQAYSFRKRLTDALIGLALCIGAFPFAFIVTILLIPLWRWLESTFQVEAVGHSGPAEWCYLSIYLLTLALAGMVWSRFKKSRHKGQG